MAPWDISRCMVGSTLPGLKKTSPNQSSTMTVQVPYIVVPTAVIALKVVQGFPIRISVSAMAMKSVYSGQSGTASQRYQGVIRQLFPVVVKAEQRPRHVD